MVLEPTHVPGRPTPSSTPCRWSRERAARHGIALDRRARRRRGHHRRRRAAVQAGACSTWCPTPSSSPPTAAAWTSARSGWTTSSSVTVTDTGVGIPPEDRERIFESFQQGGRGVAREEGTGLGLTLSRRIVELFDGRLWLESEVGVGSTFGFAVPAATATRVLEPSPRHRTRRGPDGPARRRRPRVAGPDGGLPRGLGTCASSGPRTATRRCGSPARCGRRRRARHPAAPARRLAGARPAAGGPGHRRTSRSSSPRWSTSAPRGLALGAAEYLLKPVSRDDLLGALGAGRGRACTRVGPVEPGAMTRRAHPRGRGQPAQPQAGP